MIKTTAKSSGWPTAPELYNIAEEELKSIFGDVFRTAVKLSPVYTGAYRASWRISFNVARTDVTAPGTPENPRRGAAFRWPAGFKLGDTVIISNAQPYAELIEYGWSNQAPLGVMRVASLLAQR